MVFAILNFQRYLAMLFNLPCEQQEPEESLPNISGSCDTNILAVLCHLFQSPQSRFLCKLEISAILLMHFRILQMIP